MKPWRNSILPPTGTCLAQRSVSRAVETMETIGEEASLGEALRHKFSTL